MEKTLQKYIGRTVEIIYLDRDNHFTKRHIEIWSIRSGSVKAYCYDRQAPRVFRIENILAVQPVMYRAV